VRRRQNKWLRFLLYFVLPAFLIIIFLVSFFAFKKLVLPYDLKFKDGSRLSTYAAQIREDLLKRRDIEVVAFNSKDGLKLSGYLLKRRGAIGNIVVAHGFQSCKEIVSPIIDIFPDYNLLLFDFRAHGKSEGRFRTLGCHEYKDLFAAVDFMRESTRPKGYFTRDLPLFVVGISMGGAIALDAVKKRPDLCDALVVESPFANLSDVINRSFKLKSKLPAYPFAYVIKKMTNYVANCDVNSVSIIKDLDKVKQPIFFIHTCNDDTVSIKDSINMYSHSTNNKSKIWITRPCTHAKIYRDISDIYRKKVYKFLKTCVA